MGNLEVFLQGDRHSLPTIVRAGLAHVQFETIHPFLDGNGRIGRLLITLVLCHAGLLREPVLYLSLFLKQHREEYFGFSGGSDTRVNGKSGSSSCQRSDTDGGGDKCIREIWTHEPSAYPVAGIKSRED